MQLINTAPKTTQSSDQKALTVKHAYIFSFILLDLELTETLKSTHQWTVA